jgi:hypothetical protein
LRRGTSNLDGVEAVFIRLASSQRNPITSFPSRFSKTDFRSLQRWIIRGETGGKIKRIKLLKKRLLVY